MYIIYLFSVYVIETRLTKYDATMNGRRFRARLHQASVSTLRQLCDDASDTVLIENNGVVKNGVATVNVE